MKASEIRNMTTAELEAKLKELKDELFRLSVNLVAFIMLPPSPQTYT